MGKWDQGLGAIGLIGLAAVMTGLVAIGAPMASSHSTLELKDWLGFAGNILGGFVTLIAAYVAWKAVQPQILAQRNATLLDVTTREEDRLEAELAAINALDQLYSATVRIHENKVASLYFTALSDEGISSSPSTTYSTIQAKVAGQFPPGMIRVLAFGYSDLHDVLADLDGVERRIQVDQVHGREPTPESLETASRLRELVAMSEDIISTFMFKLFKRRDLITDTLLPICRARIEEGLGLPHKQPLHD